MVFEDYVTIVSLVLLVISYAGYQLASRNPYLKYKDQKAGGCK
jgi:hypothetical protein